ncbi:hypothetical protein GCM10022277_32590 [Litoribacillus peritrichatus]|uniref:Uncharacterized protein n=1 Tax=Litoribacillus peritrichatus TaxID=718191 RepID=A0ABP7MZL3_9GAMM
MLALNDPLFRGCVWYAKAMLLHGVDELCPKDFGQSSSVEQVLAMFLLPSMFVFAEPAIGHDEVNVRVEL